MRVFQQTVRGIAASRAGTLDISLILPPVPDEVIHPRRSLFTVRGARKVNSSFVSGGIFTWSPCVMT